LQLETGGAEHELMTLGETTQTVSAHSSWEIPIPAETVSRVFKEKAALLHNAINIKWVSSSHPSPHEWLQDLLSFKRH
jgi:hypothetical protein